MSKDMTDAEIEMSLCAIDGEAEIDVYHICLLEDPDNGYYEHELYNIADMLKELEPGDGYIIEKVKMKAVDYFNLPEFEGF